ncbi:hypothetical protein PG984_005353 [Apiospora sp. TS-2023a]
MASPYSQLNPELCRLLRECQEEADFGTLQHLLRHTNEDMSIKHLPLAGEDGFYSYIDNTFFFDRKRYANDLNYMILDMEVYGDEIARRGIDTNDAANLHRFRVAANKACICLSLLLRWISKAKSLDIAFHVAARHFVRPLTAAERNKLARFLKPRFDLGRMEPWFGRDRPFLQAQCNGAPSAAGVASEGVRGRPSSPSQQTDAPRPSAALAYAEGPRISVLEDDDRLRAIMGGPQVGANPRGCRQSPRPRFGGSSPSYGIGRQAGGGGGSARGLIARWSSNGTVIASKSEDNGETSLSQAEQVEEWFEKLYVREQAERIVTVVLDRM